MHKIQVTLQPYCILRYLGKKALDAGVDFEIVEGIDGVNLTGAVVNLT